MTDPEFIKISQTLPNSCELCIRYKKTEPKPIVGNFNMASVTSGSNSGISKKSLYKPAPKQRIKPKHTNRKPLVQSQLVDLNNPRSAKICKNGMKSLPTLERNFLSPDVQRRETICTPGSTCKKNPHLIVSATEIKSNSSFFNKDANTTLPSDMKKKNRLTLIKVTMNRGFAWRWLFWERCMKERKLLRSLGYQLTHKLPTPWQRKECLHLRSWGSCLSQKSPLFIVVTLSYFLLQNLCSTKEKGGRTVKACKLSPLILSIREGVI